MCCYFHFFSYFSLPISPIDQTETFTNAPSTDLKPYVLEVFVYLMRAQARECILKRLQMENSRDYETLLIESQCLMNEYNKIHYDIQTNSINFPACWEGLIPLKTEYYKALSHVYFAKKIAQKNEIAEEKNRLKTIQAHLQTAQSSHEEILRLQRMCRELRVSLMSFFN
jgi:hypothetical protein